MPSQVLFFDDPISMRTLLEERSIPVPECGCWIWLYSMSGYFPHQYGTMSFRKKQIKAHRLSWIAYNGEIPQGMNVLHRCDTTLCINPDHLFLGTHQENMADMMKKGRHWTVSGDDHPMRKNPELHVSGDNHPARKIPLWRAGVNNGRAKITEQDVFEIRDSSLSRKELAAKYGIAACSIGEILRGKKWKHLLKK